MPGRKSLQEESDDLKKALDDFRESLLHVVIPFYRPIFRALGLKMKPKYDKY